MKKEDILVDGVYADGKQGLRRVVRLNVPASDLKYGGEQSDDKDFLQYEVLHARGGVPAYGEAAPSFCTRASLAIWAKARVPEAQVPAALAELLASSAKVSPAGQALLWRLLEAQAGHPHAQTLASGERRTAQGLAAQSLLFIPSGSNLARLAPAGEAWLRQHQPSAKAPGAPRVGLDPPVPVGPSCPATVILLSWPPLSGNRAVIMADDFVPPEGFSPDLAFGPERVLSRRQKLRRKFRHQMQKCTPFIQMSRRRRRELTVAQGWLIKSDPNGRGQFTSHDILPGSQEWPDPEHVGQTHWADLYVLPRGRQPDRFFNVTLTTVSMTWAHAIIEHVEAAIASQLTPQDRERGRLRPYFRRLPSGGSEMIFAPKRGLVSLGGLTIEGAQAQWLRAHWADLATLVHPVGESARLDPSYAYGVGLYLVTAEPTLSVEAVARAVEVFHEHGDQAYEAPPEDFETHRPTIEAMLKGRLWQWDASEARARGEAPPADPAEDVLCVMDESNAIRLR